HLRGFPVSFPGVPGWALSSPQELLGVSRFLTLFSSRAPSPRTVSVPGSPPGRFLGWFRSDLSLSPLSVQLSVNSKPPSSEGQGDKKDNATAPPAPPSYEEATAGEGMKSGAFPAPPAAPLHPSWAYVDPSTSPSYGSGGYPGDTELLTTFSWDDRNVRRVFIRKVYAILMVQLLVTVVIVAFFTFCEPVKGYIQTHSAWYWASYAVFFITYLILACCSGPRRYFPWNLILLSIFTLSMAYLTAMLSSYYNTKSVLLCLGITALVCLSVTIFSFQSKFDFTSYQGVLFVLLMVLFLGGLVLAVILPYQYVPWLHAIYALLGAGIFTMFLALDTQMLMGNRRYSLSPEEYIFGALNIYLDIIYIFSFFLQFFGSSQE
ncbi:PREDICTED: protein lifeguard 2, partial [Corvus brachyrhynchos]|uniref:protein lifeguard 2 n=1 Tax=Corvus brachyrhynchos TaxID=85066 RepID=UPI0008164F6B